MPDFLAYGKIVLELKAEDPLTSADEAQFLNQLKVTCLELGLLLNFGAEDKLDWKRRVNSENKTAKRPIKCRNDQCRSAIN